MAVPLNGIAQAGEGLPAMHADSPDFVAWAVSCALERGPGLITQPDSIPVSHGAAADATGKADLITVSLGDGGSATLGFAQPVFNGPGPDFAVFENSFDGSFLELGFVEVSSDGEHFVRFPAVSLSPAESQIGPFGILNPDDIHNLAGKHPAGWGTPFDLEDLADSAGVDLQRVTEIRIRDVIGILDSLLGSRDASGRLVNDPWPTPFETCGFDLDAVGVLHQHTPAQENALESGPIHLYPLPCREEAFLESGGGVAVNWYLIDLNGRILKHGRLARETVNIPTADLSPGMYFIRCEGGDRRYNLRMIKE
jgi:hypothetical protein